jgi:hypothetical protein
MKHFFTISLCFLALSLSAQEACPNTYDGNADGSVTINDLLDLLGVFGDSDTDSVADILELLGQFGCTSGCAVDLNDDDATNVQDILILLAAFGTEC